MKKTIAVLLIAILSVSLLASCAKGASYDGYETGASAGNNASISMLAPAGGSSAFAPDMPAEMPMPMPSAEVWRDDADVAFTSAESGPGVVPSSESTAGEGLAEKIIYTVYADIETISFDETVERVYDLIAFNGAFIESSYVGGKNYAATYYGWQTFRSANFTIRVPVARLNAVTASLDSLGNVTSLRSDAENITSQFFDTQSRLNSYRTQEERLLDMLSKADNVPDMIAIEQRLAEVRYSIESLTTTLNNWQSRVDYSTMTLYIAEVETFTEITPVQQRTFWQQIGDGLQSRTIGVGRFFMDLFKWFTINLPVLIILAIIAVVVVLLSRRRIRRRKEKRASENQSARYQYPNQYANQYPNQYPGQYNNRFAERNAEQDANRNPDVSRSSDQAADQNPDAGKDDGKEG